MVEDGCVVAHPSSMPASQASEFSPDFPPESVWLCQCVSWIPAGFPQCRNPNPTQIPRLLELKAGPSFLVSPRVLCVPRGWSAEILSGWDTCKCERSNCCWNEFQPFFPSYSSFFSLFLGQVSSYFYIYYWWQYNQWLVYFTSFSGMIWSFKADLANCDSWCSFSSMAIKMWMYSTMVLAGNNKNPPNIWKWNVQWILTKKINRFNLLWWPAFTSLHVHLPPAPDFVPLGYLWKVLAFSPLGVSAQGRTAEFLEFLVDILVFQNNTGHARNCDSVAPWDQLLKAIWSVFFFKRGTI